MGTFIHKPNYTVHYEGSLVCAVQIETNSPYYKLSTENVLIIKCGDGFCGLQYDLRTWLQLHERIVEVAIAPTNKELKVGDRWNYTSKPYHPIVLTSKI